MKSEAKPKASGGDSSLGGDDPSWHLGRNKHVVVRQFKGQTYIDIRNVQFILKTLNISMQGSRMNQY